MINAAAMLLFLWLAWIALAPSGAPTSLAIAGVAAVAVLLVAWRLGALGGGAFAHAARLIVFALARAGLVLRGAVRTVRAALAADVTLKPALVRIRTRESSAAAQAAFANLVSATPGAVVVEADAEGLLVHVIEEDRIDAAHLTALETSVIGAIDGKART